ncbi:MAG: DUF6737 family protein [Cyanobacteriota bacterium]|nr:DUF6737 family protein [Cyanobacteriota bacterium]
METQPPGALARYRLFWRHKPWWCQPWTIVLTGSLAIVVSLQAQRLLQFSWWLVAPVLMAILGWWVLFLILVPFSVTEE